MTKKMELNMLRMAISRWSIVTKLTVMVFVIFLSVGGILTVNIVLFFQVKDSLVSMIDRDVVQTFENARLIGELNDVFAQINLLIYTFPERQKTLRAEKERIVKALQENVKLIIHRRKNLQTLLQEYNQRAEIPE